MVLKINGCRAHTISRFRSFADFNNFSSASFYILGSFLNNQQKVPYSVGIFFNHLANCECVLLKIRPLHSCLCTTS